MKLSFLHLLNRTFEGTLTTSFGATSKAGGILSAGQRQVFECIEHAISGVGSPVEITGPEALEALRVSEGYEGLPTSSPLGSYNPDLVSLPSGEMNPVSLESLLGSRRARSSAGICQRSSSRSVRGSGQVDRERSAAGLPRSSVQQFQDFCRFRDEAAWVGPG